MSGPDQTDDFIDEVVASYIQEQIAAGEAAGHSQAQIEASFNAASLILCAKMLARWGGDHMPEGSELLYGLGQLTGSSDAECRQLCKEFIRAGWMDASYSLTESGRALARMEQE